MEHQTDSFGIKTILVNCANSAKYCDEVVRSGKYTHQKKKFFRDAERMLLSIEKGICAMLPSEAADQIRKEVSENWETLAVLNVQNAMMAMNEAQLQILESVCAHILEGTFRIEGEQTK